MPAPMGARACKYRYKINKHTGELHKSKKHNPTNKKFKCERMFVCTGRAACSAYTKFLWRLALHLESNTVKQSIGNHSKYDRNKCESVRVILWHAEKSLIPQSSFVSIRHFEKSCGSYTVIHTCTSCQQRSIWE